MKTNTVSYFCQRPRCQPGASTRYQMSACVSRLKKMVAKCSASVFEADGQGGFCALRWGQTVSVSFEGKCCPSGHWWSASRQSSVISRWLQGDNAPDAAQLSLYRGCNISHVDDDTFSRSKFRHFDWTRNSSKRLQPIGTIASRFTKKQLTIGNRAAVHRWPLSHWRPPRPRRVERHFHDKDTIDGGREERLIARKFPIRLCRPSQVGFICFLSQYFRRWGLHLGLKDAYVISRSMIVKYAKNHIY